MALLLDGLSFAEAELRLEAAARERTGRRDFGPDEYKPGLRMLLRSLDEDADLSPAGRQICAGLIVTALSGRLEAEASMAADPELRTAGIPAPIVILGLPRTGTTALQKMLCSDPRHQGLELWLAQSPMPRPARSTWEAHPAYRRCVQATEAMHAAAPEMAAIHAMAADEADECWNLLRQSFASVTFECVARVRSYAAWWAGCDMGPAYRRWADQLRLIGRGDPDRRWVLKDPSHLFALDALLAVVPDALLVMTHRDPAKSVPSVCSLNATARRANDRVPDDAALGREQLELWARGIERTLAVRAREPERFVDVAFEAFVADPLAVVRRIQERAGLARDARSEERMAKWIASHPSQPHRYEAERFGLRAEAIRERFGAYLEACDVTIET